MPVNALAFSRAIVWETATISEWCGSGGNGRKGSAFVLLDLEELDVDLDSGLDLESAESSRNLGFYDLWHSQSYLMQPVQSRWGLKLSREETDIYGTINNKCIHNKHQP